ncbi:hypothetical protein DNTS_030480 [Danionella cerebrum]|uniref:Uncharacterized protein n=1 Tax=Danionella cerebrum TaxID=2873325 RepID=A0A553MM12_9TELE|nr:hypothetical protein DNTS_030480 [Danionella translucida]
MVINHLILRAVRAVAQRTESIVGDDFSQSTTKRSEHTSSSDRGRPDEEEKNLEQHNSDLDPYDGSSEGSGSSEDERGKGDQTRTVEEHLKLHQTDMLMEETSQKESEMQERTKTMQRPQQDQEMVTRQLTHAWSKTRTRAQSSRPRSRAEPKPDSEAEMELCDSGLHSHSSISSTPEVNLQSKANTEVFSKRKLPDASAEEDEEATRRKRHRTRDLENISI